MEHFGSFLGCLSSFRREKVCTALSAFVLHFIVLDYMFSMRISLVLAWILLVFYYSSIMIIISSLVFSSASVVVIIIKRVVGYPAQRTKRDVIGERVDVGVVVSQI